VPFAAGGAADTMGRLYIDALTAAFGKQFYIENRIGGGGLVGTEAVARAEPDGLTLMVSGIPTHVLGPAMNKNVGFDPMRDFTHIAYFGGTPNVVVFVIKHLIYQRSAKRGLPHDHYESQGLFVHSI
jgi:tripartite-type tricarboxylate transporter receptor subunit TctC